MKTSLLAAIMIALVLLVGCATEEAADDVGEETEAPPPAAPEEGIDTAPAVTEAETPPVVPEAEEKTTEDVLFSGSGFDPAEIKVGAGSTVNVLVKDEGSVTYSFIIKETGDRTTKIANGEMAELAFEEAGEYTVMSVPFSRKLAVTVE